MQNKTALTSHNITTERNNNYFGGIMKFFVNSDCIGCGLCTSVCPEVFSMTDENVAQAADAELAGQTAALAQQAMEQCPVSAIEHS